VRAYDPWPGTFTFWGGRRVKILATKIGEGSTDATPGTVVQYGDGIAVATADIPLIITSLQLEGKKAQSGEEFARAYPDFIKATLQ
jgi:methionyl-tRNA formyltransferase